MSTKIAWTDETWNVVTGCSPVSPGCRNCYAARTAATRLKHHPRYEGLAYIASGRPRWNGEIRLHRELLGQPLRWRKPRMIFVCSMGDLFHEDVPAWFIDDVFSQMFVCSQHTFQVLTKRAARMLRYWKTKSYTPPSNAWLGVSVERADYLWRIEELLKTPAAVRFVSLEPLLGAIDLRAYLQRWNYRPRRTGGKPFVEKGGLDWVILGAESGPDRRPFDTTWALDVYEQCQRAGVPFFGKQDSGLRPGVPLLLDGREVKEWPHGE